MLVYMFLSPSPDCELWKGKSWYIACNFSKLWQGWEWDNKWIWMAAGNFHGETIALIYASGHGRTLACTHRLKGSSSYPLFLLLFSAEKVYWRLESCAEVHCCFSFPPPCPGLGSVPQRERRVRLRPYLKVKVNAGGSSYRYSEQVREEPLKCDLGNRRLLLSLICKEVWKRRCPDWFSPSGIAGICFTLSVRLLAFSS